MTPEQISSSFHHARRSSSALTTYPGEAVPPDLDTAYRIQEAAIEAWPDRIGGWKVAMIQPAWRETYPSERLAGPVFSQHIWEAGEQLVRVPVIEQGYAAVEAEFAIRIVKDVPADAIFTEPMQLLPYIEGVYAAIELAASPLASLSALGPGAVISDFGNNSGLVLGPRLPDALLCDPADAPSETEINGEAVGSGSAEKVPGGPLGALLFLHGHLATRGRILHAGDLVSTGATTGIHAVRIGDQVKVSFYYDRCITAEIVAGTPA